jgi:hypothetical protein
LKGRPDALVRTESGDFIPVERKKTRAPRRGPYDGDLLQTTAYCILVEEDCAPPFMRIQYSDRWFDEPYTPELKRWILGGVREAPPSASIGGLPPVPPDCSQMPQLRAGLTERGRAPASRAGRFYALHGRAILVAP